MQKRESVKPFLLIAGGAVVFLVTNAILFLSRCSSRGLWFDCSGNPGEHGAIVLTAGVVVAIAAVVSRAGRSFATGFGGTLLGLAIATAGSCTPSWADPYHLARKQIAPYEAKWKRDRENAEAHALWKASLDAQPMDVTRGVQLAGSILRCAQTYQTTKGRIAAREDDLVADCPDVRDWRASFDSGPTIRYALPRDPGWRVSYVPSASSYVVDVAPDAALGHKFPRLRADSTGMVHVVISEQAAPIALTPAAELRRLVDCVKQIPPEAERRKVSFPKHESYSWHLTDLVKRGCAELAPRLTNTKPYDSDATILSMMVPSGPGGAPMPAVMYTIGFVARQPVTDPPVFDLTATPAVWGLPRYLATFEGAVHRTMEPRAARPDDSQVER